MVARTLWDYEHEMLSMRAISRAPIERDGNPTCPLQTTKYSTGITREELVSVVIMRDIPKIWSMTRSVVPQTYS